MASKRLTKEMRHVFVKAVMTDIAKPDDNVCSKELQEYLKIGMPKEAVALLDQGYDDWLEGSSMTVWPEYNSEYSEKYYRTSANLRYKWHGWNSDDFPQEAQDYIERVRGILTNREKLRDKILGVVNACTTIKQLKEALPEFEKYAPDDIPSVKAGLPVIGDLMADVVALGWPGGKVINAQIVQGATA